jgi:hypothetical protein
MATWAKIKTIPVYVHICPPEQSPPKAFKTERRKLHFAITSAVGLRFQFCKDWHSPPEQPDSESFFVLEISSVKADEMFITTVGSTHVCACHHFPPPAGQV